MSERKLRSINKTTTPAAPEPAGVIEVVESTTAVATLASPSVPALRSSVAPLPASSGIVGDWDASDIKFPTLKIVQGSGARSQSFNLGTLLLGDEELLPPPDLKSPKSEHTFRFVPVTLEKQFRENLTQDESAAGGQSRIVGTLAEVEALGGTTQWIGDQKPSWSPSARILLLVERPEGLPGSGSDHPGFCLELDGRLFAPAVYYASGSSWTSFAKVLYNATLTSLTVVERDAAGNPVKGPTGVIRRLPYLPKSYWSWRTVRRAAGEYLVFAPEIRLTRDETSDELRSFVDTLRG